MIARRHPLLPVETPLASGLTLLKTTLVRLYIAADAMRVDVADIRVEDFPEEAQERWKALADEHLRRFINGEVSA